MKTLLLVRHAKSSRDDATQGDRARPLNDRGRRDAPKIGARLAQRGVKPDLILSSPAARALATAEHIAAKLDCKHRKIVVDERLYAADADRLLQVIRQLDDGARCVMLVGHSPELTELANRFSDNITAMPTRAVAELRFEVRSWARIGKANLAGATLACPKDA